MKKIKFGFLGLGTVVKIKVADVFLKELKNVNVSAVFDKNKKKVIEYSKIFNCKKSQNINDFFSQDFDICYISTDSGSHYKNILDCFKNNKHVVVEKPPVLKVNQLIQLDKIAQKKRLGFYVIYQNRENKAVEYVKKYLVKNHKEKITFVNLKLLWCRMQNYYSRWHGKWKTDGGVLAQQGIHSVDLLCHFFGKPIQSVSLMRNVSNKLQAEDTNAGLIKFKKVDCTYCLTTALRPKDLGASIEIFMQKKIIKLDGLCCNKLSIHNYDNSQKKLLEKISKKNSQKVKNGIGVSHTKCFKEIIKKLRKQKANPLKAIDTLETLKLINMLYKSCEQNKWVRNENKISSRLGN